MARQTCQCSFGHLLFWDRLEKLWTHPLNFLTSSSPEPSTLRSLACPLLQTSYCGKCMQTEFMWFFTYTCPEKHIKNVPRYCEFYILRLWASLFSSCDRVVTVSRIRFLSFSSKRASQRCANLSGCHSACCFRSILRYTGKSFRSTPCSITSSISCTVPCGAGQGMSL